MDQIVPPIGPRNSPKIAIVGEAPGEEEVKRGEPFVGSSGFLLNQMLAVAGIPRGECYITNLSLVRPPKNDFRKMYYDDKLGKCPNNLLLDCRARLWDEIKQVKPSVVITLGNEATKALTHVESLKTYRGTMINTFGLRVIPTYHPAFVLRSYDMRPVVEADLKKAWRQAINPSVPKTYFNIDPTFDEVMRFISERPAKLALDIETIANTTRCIGLACSKHEAISIPFISARNNHWSESEETEILHELNKLFLCPDVGFYLQNAPYDFTILARDFGFQIANQALDTMFAHHLLFPELPKGLDFLSSIYTDHEMYWGYDSKSDKSTRKYNCMDCVVTFEAAEEIIDQLKKRNLLDYYRSIIHQAVPALTRVQSRGVLINNTARTEIATETQKSMDEAQAKINQILGHELNPSSPKQVKELIYDKWKLPTQYKQVGPDKKVTSDEDALKILCKKTNDPSRIQVLQNLIEYRQKRVLLSTFAEMALKNGRVHTSYNLAGTVTGRISSSSTFDGYGGNLQNIPRGSFRRVFQADPGKVLVKADLSQAEYRVLIWKARIQRVIDRFLNDPKFSIHMWNAAENIYRVPYDQITKQMYQDAKNGVYGANYGIGPHKVSRMYNIDFRDAKFIIERYHQAVPEIKGVYQRELVELVQQTRTIRNPLGRERVFFGRMDDELFRAVYSHYCQSTVADIILAALIDLDQQEVDILLQVHDELVCQFEESKLVEGVSTVRKAMERPVVIEGVKEPLIIPCEIKVGYNWYETTSLEEFLTRKDKSCQVLTS